MFEYKKLNGENWIYPWIMTFPLVTLGISGVLFTVGLCTFAFSFGEVSKWACANVAYFENFCFYLQGRSPSIAITSLAGLLLAMIFAIAIGYKTHQESVKTYRGSSLAGAFMPSILPGVEMFQTTTFEDQGLPFTRDGGIH